MVHPAKIHRQHGRTGHRPGSAFEAQPNFAPGSLQMAVRVCAAAARSSVADLLLSSSCLTLLSAHALASCTPRTCRCQTLYRSATRSRIHVDTCRLGRVGIPEWEEWIQRHVTQPAESQFSCQPPSVGDRTLRGAQIDRVARWRIPCGLVPHYSIATVLVTSKYGKGITVPATYSESGREKGRNAVTPVTARWLV